MRPRKLCDSSQVTTGICTRARHPPLPRRSVSRLVPRRVPTRHQQTFYPAHASCSCPCALALARPRPRAVNTPAQAVFPCASSNHGPARSDGRKRCDEQVAQVVACQDFGFVYSLQTSTNTSGRADIYAMRHSDWQGFPCPGTRSWTRVLGPVRPCSPCSGPSGPCSLPSSAPCAPVTDYFEFPFRSLIGIIDPFVQPATRNQWGTLWIAVPLMQEQDWTWLS